MNNMYQQPPPSHKHSAASGTSLVTERIAELLDQLKNEYSQMESEFSITKSQRDDYERKLEAQLAEFQNMKQTIVELEVSYQNIKQQYEDKISHLQSQLKQYQQSQSSISASPIPSSSHLQSSQSAPQPPHLMRQAPSNLPSSSSQERRGQTPPPLSAGRRSPPPLINQQPAQKKPRMGGVNSLLSSSNSSQPEDFTFPPAPGSATGSSHQGGHYSMMSSGGYSENPRQPMQSGVPGISSFNNELDTNGSPTGAGMMHGDGKNGANGGMLKKEGNDWVVVYNPQVKTNVNIQLAHNIDHHSVVCCVRFSQDGKYLATGSNRLAQIFNVETGQRIRTFPAEDVSKNGSKSPSPPLKPMSPGPGEGTFDPTTMGSDKEDSFVRSVCFSPDGKYLVAGAEDKTVKVWDIKTGALKNAFHGHELDIYSLDFSSDNRYIVSGSGDGKAKIWNMETAKCEHTLGNEEIGPKEGVTSVAISPDGRIVAAGSLDCVVRLWDVQTGKFQESFVGHDDSVYSVAFSPDGKILASGSLDKTLKLWDLRSSSYRCIATLNGHRDYVLSVAFSPDGKWLISGSKDRSVQFWDPRSNVLHLMLQGHKNSVISVALNPQMPIFATGSGDYRARIWQWSAIL